MSNLINFLASLSFIPNFHDFFFMFILVKIPLKQESHIKKKILNNRLIIKDFFG